MTTSIIILAAGCGKRMNATLPKVLHRLGHKPLLAHVIETAKTLLPDAIYVVYNPQQPQLQQQLSHLKVTWVEQKKALGTADAVAKALPFIANHHRVLILCGDVPLITHDTLRKLLATPADHVAWLIARVTNPYGLGRIMRNNRNEPIAIVEEADLNAAQSTIAEVNSGICALPAKLLKRWLSHIDCSNKQQEYYLTSLFALAVKNHITLTTVMAKEDGVEVSGVNDHQQLAKVERAYQWMQAQALMVQGVELKDPKRFDLRGTLCCAKDVVIDIDVVISGNVTIGKGSVIGPYVWLQDVDVGAGVVIHAHSVIVQAKIANHCHVGPFAHIRPGSCLQAKSRIGNFVEIKNSVIGEHSKVGHLSYIGDTDMGKAVNIGAGTITCNYDGINKHRTTIKDNAFIGATNNLVAPITIGEGATTASGSTLTKDAPAGQLTLARARQKTIAKWQRPKPKKDQ